MEARVAKLDYHVHESYSSDAREATVEAYARAAEAKGVEEIAFTTHLIITGPDADFGVQPEELPMYVRGIREAQDDTDVRLRVGLEADYFPEVERELETLLDEHPLDYVLGSTHYIHGVDVGSRRQFPRFFGGRSLVEAVDEYFSVFKQAVESGFFDVMAHPDYFRKFLSLVREDPITWEEFGTVVYEAFDSMAEHGVGFEVNTSCHRHGIGENYPIQGFINQAYEAGVRSVTVGTDSHDPQILGYRTLEALESLREAGYRTLSTYEGRRNRKISIADAI